MNEELDNLAVLLYDNRCTLEGIREKLDSLMSQELITPCEWNVLNGCLDIAAEL